MGDVVDQRTRSRMMAGIRGKDTTPELFIRKWLHAEGLRFRLHRRDLPGRPDLVFPKYRTVLFVHGCFWHGHDCPAFKWPQSNRMFWRSKIEANRARDLRVKEVLAEHGWQVIVIWECDIRLAVRAGEAGPFSRRVCTLVKRGASS